VPKNNFDLIEPIELDQIIFFIIDKNLLIIIATLRHIEFIDHQPISSQNSMVRGTSIAARSLWTQRKEERESIMATELAGMRCRATRAVRSHRGLIKRSAEGTIQHDIENLGRHLISVRWDGGITDYVFPFEIEIVTDEKLIRVA
jgi:hypothetical protein